MKDDVGTFYPAAAKSDMCSGSVNQGLPSRNLLKEFGNIPPSQLFPRDFVCKVGSSHIPIQDEDKLSSM